VPVSPSSPPRSSPVEEISTAVPDAQLVLAVLRRFPLEPPESVARRVEYATTRVSGREASLMVMQPWARNVILRRGFSGKCRLP
jgi:hypothetical protein